MKTEQSTALFFDEKRGHLEPKLKPPLPNILVGGIAGLLIAAAITAPWYLFFPQLPVVLKLLLNALVCTILGMLVLYLFSHRPFWPRRLLGLPPRPSRLGFAIEAERKRLYALLDGLPAIVYLKAPDYTIRFANRHFRTRYGDPGDRLCYDVVHGRATPCEFCPTESVFQGRQPFESERIFPDGTIYQLYDYPFVDVDGTDLVLQLGIDVTLRRQAEAALERTNAELLALSQAERSQRLFAEGLAQAALALNSSLEMEEVLDAILEQTQRVIPYHAAALMLCEGERVYMARHRGMEQFPELLGVLSPGLSVQDLPLLETVCYNQQGVLIADVQLEPRWPSVPELEWVRSFAAVPLTREEQVVGLIALFGDQVDFFSQESIDRLHVFATHADLVLRNVRLFEEMREGRRRLQALSRRLVEVQESERRYVARELHDEVGQALTSLRVKLGLLERQGEAPAAIRLGLIQLSAVIEQVMENLHRLAIDLRPASLDHLGLEAALRQHCTVAGTTHNLSVQLEALHWKGRLSPETEVALYRIVQEALNNVVQHAHASHADVILDRRDGHVLAIVEDNGCGFDPKDVGKNDRLGLLGIRERAEALGGTLLIESAPGSGTTIRVEVPCDDSYPDR
jgi:signal transduction histidine kinase